jgi:extracellular elastinolytic metalloproteinase
MQARPGRMLLATLVLAALISALAAGGALALISPQRSGPAPERTFFDVRDGADVAPTEAQRQAASALVREAGPRTRLTWDDRFGTPRTVLRYGGWLTGPREGAPVDVARAFVDANREALGLSAAGVRTLALTGDHEFPGTGTHVVSFVQTFDGVRAARGGSLGVAVAGDGRVLSYTGATVRDGSLAGTFALSAAQALERVAGNLAGGVAFTARASGVTAGYRTFERGPFAASSYVRRTAFPTAGGVRPAYRVLFIRELDRAWDVIVDAESGRILYRDSLVDFAQPEGTVYENFPGDAGSGGQPVIRSFGPTPESPSGYVDPTGLTGVPGPTTFGNNANTYANYSNDLVPADQAPRPVSPTSQFNYVYRMNWQRTNGQTVPPSYVLDMEPATTNLFWHHNRVHDEFYRLGFNESGGNFQVNNDGNGGQGGDPILGLVHAGAATGGAPTYTGRDNAYMLTLPDGIPPWSGMFLWEPINDAFEGPYSDGNFDASVIEHEYAHGLSNRYVSTEDNALNSHQSGSMGEGWGDWYGLNYLHREGLYDKAVVGEFVTGNSVRGIRNWSYDRNPTGFGDIGYDIVGAEVHADGEIWTTILWDMRRALVAEYGQAEGSEIAARLVTDAMPLSPVDPSFLDMRDAIIKALDNRYHARPDYGRIFDIVYTAFARRGAGLHASTDGGNDTDPTPAFDHVDPARNGTLVGRVVNAATGEPVGGARVMIGVFEARVSPLRATSATGGFAAPVVAGTYPVTVQAPGFGSRTFGNVRVAAGQTARLQFALQPNLASGSNGAKVLSATNPNAQALIDDTEASSWKSDRDTGRATVRLARSAEISSFRVSAFTSSRFEALKSFTLQTSTDGTNWRTVRSGPAFSYQRPRPTTPDVHYRTFKLATPVRARFVRFWTDAPFGETKNSVQTAELQVFSATAQGVEPLPPEPPGPPVTDEGTIDAGNPASDTAAGVTMADLEQNCTVPPATQGADGWVTRLPESFGDGMHRVEVRGDSAAPYDLDLYFYDATCERVGSAASSAVDESGTLPSGTRYVLTQLWAGANVSFTLTATG